MIFLLSGFTALGQKPQISVETIVAVYREKNLWIQNPALDNSVGFTIQQIWINGKKVSDYLSSSGIEIDLKRIGLVPGERFELQIKYCSDKPFKVLNPEVLGL